MASATALSRTSTGSAVERAAESADVAPTTDATTAFQRDQQAVQEALAQWNELKSKDMARLNSLLKRANLQPLSLEETE